MRRPSPCPSLVGRGVGCDGEDGLNGRMMEDGMNGVNGLNGRMKADRDRSPWGKDDG